MATVLIAEDDIMVADMLEESLTGAGYMVCGIAELPVDEGIALGQRYKAVYLALIDLRLASAGLGTEIAARLDRTGKLGILYATGSASQIHLTQADGVACLNKPYLRGEDAVRALQIVEEIVTAGTTSRDPVSPVDSVCSARCRSIRRCRDCFAARLRWWSLAALPVTKTASETC